MLYGQYYAMALAARLSGWRFDVTAQRNEEMISLRAEWRHRRHAILAAGHFSGEAWLTTGSQCAPHTRSATFIS